MDNTSINVTDINATMNLGPGEYRIYGNKTANLAIPEFEKGNKINLYPNPVLNHFTLNIATTKVQVYAMSGQLVKSFTPNGNTDFQFGVSELKTGFYIVKAIDENNKVQVMKFIKK